MSDLRVRRLAPDDWEVYREVRLRMLQDAPDAFASRYEQAVERTEADWREVLHACDHHLAERDGAPVGAAGLVLHGREANLIGMWVSPPFRGSGAGEVLVEAVCRRAAELGHPRVLLDVVEGNDRARRFYERCGFRFTGRRQLVPGRQDAWEDQMARELG
ncbi:MAG TPA: GNAT family N-acetyltransferase [Segeticoccus sp.]|uniref:GNAT family N-acetyltransferase n=1 Tax=Segeticoccus sp. TaxID=2706531 RepID=UPI002D7F00CD|nr:GNAT family N-acetyltransferase [Segeticoccus sp.]HET8599168.1 GNAT family N-acetyltransferase [Segeticoccus sp.]